MVKLMVYIKINYNNELIVPLCLNTGRDCNITDVRTDDNGNLIVTLEGGEVHNLGQLIGKDGIIYNPHIEKDDSNGYNVFTFTIVNEPDEEVSL